MKLLVLFLVLVGFVEKWVAENKTEHEIEGLIEKVCAVLPEPYKGECDELVEEYLPFIINFLEEELPPKKVCQLIGLCPTKEVNAIGCDLCTFVVGAAEQWLAENKTEHEIEHLIEKLCAVLPSPYKEDCNHLVEEYLPFIINFLEEEMPPKKVCQLIGFCPTEVNSAPPDTVSCDMCKFVVGFVEKWLRENKTEHEIEHLIEGICRMLPPAMKGQCDEIVEEYLPFIIAFLEEFATPEKVCEVLTLCPKPETPRKKEKDGAGCDICEYVVKVVDDLLKMNSTVKEIENVVEKICAMLPNPYKGMCDSLVEQYLPLIIQWLESKTPEEICQMLGLCPKELVELDGLDACSICEWMVKMVEQYLASNKTEEEIIHELDKLCDYFPKEFISLCKTMVDEYVPTIIDYLEQSFPPKVICTAIGLCKSDQPRPTLYARN